jgi:hypothetical protein
MDDGMPRDANGLRPCEWCGDPIRQPATGRRRRYCSRTHRELAYRRRKTEGEVTTALQWDESTVQAWLVAHGVATPPVSTVDETQPRPVASVDETRGVRRSRRRGGMTASAMPLFSDE